MQGSYSKLVNVCVERRAALWRVQLERRVRTSARLIKLLKSNFIIIFHQRLGWSSLEMILFLLGNLL